MTTVKSTSGDVVLQKQMQAWRRSSMMTDNMLEYLQENNKRLAKLHEKYLADQKKSNTYKLQKQIAAVDTKILGNRESLEKNLNNIAALKRLYWGMNSNYDHSLDSIISKIRSSEFVLEQTLYEIKKNNTEANSLNIGESKKKNLSS